MKFVLSCLLLFSSFLQVGAQLNFSDSARYSIITCAPGTEVYSMYGHTALRVLDPKTGVDLAFNYGIFSFQTDNFLFKFVKGETDYQLGVYPFKHFIAEYIGDKRMVWEQKLNLTIREKQRLKELVLFDYRPENRIYRYNFFYDNCATRVRDRVWEAVEDTVVIVKDDEHSLSFRDLLDPYIRKFGWVKFGINLAVAKPADQKASFKEEMFLPEHLMENFELLMIKTNGEVRPLIEERTILNNGEAKNIPIAYPPSVWFALLLIVSIVLFYFLAERFPFMVLMAYGYFGIVGIAGLVLLFLSVFSVHPAMTPNFNLLWALPTHILVFVLMLIKPLRMGVNWYWVACIPYYFLVSFGLLLTGQFVSSSVFVINGLLFLSAILIVRRNLQQTKTVKRVSLDPK